MRATGVALEGRADEGDIGRKRVGDDDTRRRGRAVLVTRSVGQKLARV
jgi:hypothetical protein